MSGKIQVTVDESLNKAIHIQAQKMGLSVSSYARYAIKDFMARNNSNKTLLEKAMESESEEISLAAFKKQIKALKGA